MKKIFLCGLIYFFSFSCFALSMGTQHVNAKLAQCGQVSIGAPDFCDRFNAIAHCHCENAIGYCSFLTLREIYNIMLEYNDNSQLEACQRQGDTDVDTCMADWNYTLGNCPLDVYA